MKLDGQKHTIHLLDFNCNGRFDDSTTIRDDIRNDNGRVYQTHGDRIMLDFNVENADPAYYNLTGRIDRLPVEKLLFVNGKYYELTVSPSGESIELNPSKTPLGSIQNKNGVFEFALYNDQSVLKLSGKKGDPIPIPEGEWKLLEYTINLTDPAKSSQGRRSWTLLSAAGTTNCKPVKVEKGKTVEFPFGGPYKPLVRVSPMGSNNQVDQARLSLEFIDNVSAICTNLYVNGDRPPDPTFVIATPNNEIVERGKFEYG